MKTAGSGTRSLKAVTGDYATSVRQEGHQMAEKVASLHAEVECFLSSNVSAHQVGNFCDMVSDIYHKSFVFTGLVVCLCRIILTHLLLCS
jgi:hypothetical protein